MGGEPGSTCADVHGTYPLTNAANWDSAERLLCHNKIPYIIAMTVVSMRWRCTSAARSSRNRSIRMARAKLQIQMEMFHLGHKMPYEQSELFKTISANVNGL